MNLKKIKVLNYKNLESFAANFSPNISTIVGENGVGKTNLFESIRIVLDKNYYKILDESSFSSRLVNCKGHWIIFSLQLNNIGDSAEESELNPNNGESFLNCIFLPKKIIRDKLHTLSKLLNSENDPLKAFEIEFQIKNYINNIDMRFDYEKIYTINQMFDFLDPSEYQRVVGDFNHYSFPDCELDAKDIGDRINNVKEKIQNIIKVSYIPAIRNVEFELEKESNILSHIIKKIADNISESEWKEIDDEINILNCKLNRIDEMIELTSRINRKIEETIGNHYSFDLINRIAMPTEIFSILKQFRLYGSSEGKEISLSSRSLGDNNITYFALKLLENSYVLGNTQSYLNLLLIEEPESHIHKHLQKSLFSGINGISDNQLIISTHSIHISEASNISNVLVILKTDKGSISCNPTNGLSSDEVIYLERYLDSNRIPLLFSKNVILVEGISELIIIPYLLRYLYNIELDSFGISIISMESTFFDPISRIFNKDRIKEKCVILTDGDKDYSENGDFKTKEEKASKRIRNLEIANIGNDYVKIFHNEYSFEFSLFLANEQTYLDYLSKRYNNSNLFENFLEKFYLNSQYSKFKMIDIKNKEIGKGWQALEFTRFLDEYQKDVCIPNYIINGLLFILSNNIKKNNIDKMIDYKCNKFDINKEDLFNIESEFYDELLVGLYE